MPVDPAGLLEDLRSGPQGGDVLVKGLLGDRLHLAREDQVDSLGYQPRAKAHQGIVNHLGVVGVGDRITFLPDNTSGVDLVRQEKGGDASLRIAINDGPVDRRGAPILRQQRGVQVESAEAGHIPDHLWQHPEGHDDLEIGLIGTQRLEEGLIFQLDRLQDRQADRQGILLHGTCLKDAPVSSHRLVGHRDNGDHLITTFHQRPQALDRKVGRSHINNA